MTYELTNFSRVSGRGISILYKSDAISSIM
jgi:hypothetical protein